MMHHDFRSDELSDNGFFGRVSALNAFHLRFAYSHMQNGVYYYGSGGVGKTWLLRKIRHEIIRDDSAHVDLIIDFYDTQNQNLRGLQASIKDRLGSPQAFEEYDELINRADEARAQTDGMQHAVIASIEARANRAFLQCSEKATAARPMVLLFDTFERVQQRYVGRWLLESFLPEVRGVIVAIAGRPIVSSSGILPVHMPHNILSYRLRGLSSTDIGKYVLDRWQNASDADIELVSNGTRGSPLLVELILDLDEGARADYLDLLTRAHPNAYIETDSKLQVGLLGQFSQQTEENRLIWSMACLHRRFDMPIFEFLRQRAGEWLRLDGGDDPEKARFLLESLSQRPYIKNYQEDTSHLLHDEIQQLVANHMLKQSPEVWDDMLQMIREPIVTEYYPQAIRTADRPLRQQLQAEHLAYTLERDTEVGLKVYFDHRKTIESSSDHDLEELLWGEVRDALGPSAPLAEQTYIDRGNWLRSHNLFAKAEDHYSYMLATWPSPPLHVYQRLGFVQMRQSKYSEANEVFSESLAKVDRASHSDVAMIENNLGQLSHLTGSHDEALRHYALGFRAATMASSREYMASIMLNRGYTYSLLGKYSKARDQCTKALNLLEDSDMTPENVQRRLHAWLYLGTAWRHSGNYDDARIYYLKCLELAERRENHEAVCNATQNLGINEFLLGRLLRRQLLEMSLSYRADSVPITERQDSFDNSTIHQLGAWQYLEQASSIAILSDWRSAIADSLNRFAKVYREIDRLEKLLLRDMPDLDMTDSFAELQWLASHLALSVEAEYEDELVIPGDFSELSWMERSARLFDISACVADDADSYHRALDSLTELANILLELNELSSISSVIDHVGRLKGYDYEESLYVAVIGIIRAHLEYKQERLETALELYAQSFEMLAKHTGYATYMLLDRLRDFEWYLHSLPREQTLEWCDFLEDKWLGEGLFTSRPEMLDTLENVRRHTMAAYWETGNE